MWRQEWDLMSLGSLFQLKGFQVFVGRVYTGCHAPLVLEMSSSVKLSHYYQLSMFLQLVFSFGMMFKIIMNLIHEVTAVSKCQVLHPALNTQEKWTNHVLKSMRRRFIKNKFIVLCNKIMEWFRLKEILKVI